jgi:membrane protein DedA with SNARE-associated domain
MAEIGQIPAQVHCRERLPLSQLTTKRKPVIGPTTLIMKYGAFAVAGVVCLESMGLPLPGEAILIAAAVYAGKTGDLNIVEVIAAAAVGAMVGDNIGYWVGREIGFRLLIRYGGYVGLTEPRIKIGQYLFQRHGGKIVFFGRFVALLRVLAALLAGINRMSWPRFFVANAAGAILWATVFGFGAYALGEEIEHLSKPVAAALAIVGLVAIVMWLRFLHSHQQDLEAEAERALPGPLATRTIKRARRSHRLTSSAK